MHEIACTPIDTLATVFVDVHVPKKDEDVARLERMFRNYPDMIRTSWVLPGSFHKGPYAMPLVLPYIFGGRCTGGKSPAPLTKGVIPWCMRRLLDVETLSVIASFVLPSIRNRQALHGALEREFVIQVRLTSLLVNDIHIYIYIYIYFYIICRLYMYINIHK